MTDTPLEISLSLSTHVRPAKKFLVDGVPYDLLGSDHLTPDREAEVMALFARHNLLAQELEATDNLLKGKALAQKIRKCRLQIIDKLTTFPPEEADKLPLGAQVRLLEALQAEIEADEEEDTPEEVKATGAPPFGTDD